MFSTIRKIGKIGRRNANANARLARLWKKLGINACEHCGSSYRLTNAHRHKRIWYRAYPELLGEYNQVLRLCISCHEHIEYNAKLTEQLFNALRGPEVLQ